MVDVSIRRPTEADLEAIARIWNDSRRGLPSQSKVSADEVNAKTFLDGDYDPEGSWLAIVDGEPVGYADGFVDQARLAYGLTDSYFDLEVTRGHRGIGIEESLLRKALDYLADRGVSSTQIPHYEVDAWKKGLLENAGFREVRRYYEMVRDTVDEPEEAVFPKDVRIERHLIKDDIGEAASRLADVRNRSFVDHFNYAPIPADRLRKFLEATDAVFSTAFAVDSEGATVGFVLSEDRSPEVTGTGRREGWVAILGVVGTHRRRGLGRNLLLDSVGWLRSKEAERILLMVDAENEKALDMYKSAGFAVDSVEILMVKDLPSPDAVPGANGPRAPLP